MEIFFSYWFNILLFQLLCGNIFQLFIQNWCGKEEDDYKFVYLEIFQ
jgi:hypothetical protein